MQDKLVFDIETKNTFDDVGGRNNTDGLEVSVVGVYSYNNDAYRCYTEHEMKELEEVMKRAYLIIGFASKRFDVPVLNKYFKCNLAAIQQFDILEEIEKVLGRRIGLGVLAEANLGIGKTGHGLDAIEYYKNGEMEKLKSYCLNDVKVTKEIYELIKRQGFLWIPERYKPQMTKLALPYKEVEAPQLGLL